MAKQAECTQHVVMADPEPQATLGQRREGSLDHRHRLPVGDALRRVLQLLGGKAEPAAQAFAAHSLVTGDFGEGLQQER